MKRWILYIFFIFSMLPLHGQDIQFTMEYPAVVTVGDQFRITWIVNSGSGEFTPPSFDGLYKIMGPQTSYSQSTQIINGKITQESSYSYTYYLQAINAGKFTVAPASYTVRNKTVTSDSITIQVLKNGAGQQTIVSGNNSANSNTDSQDQGKDIYIKVTLNRNELFLGEHVIATLKIYTRIDLAGLNEIKYPDFNGFLMQEIETPPLTNLQKENINGTVYGTGVIQQFLLYPQIAGEITIDPVQITALIQQRINSADQFFGDFFATYENLPRIVVSEPVKLNVKPLPGARPESYYGSVGNFSLTSSISKDTVNVNDAITMKITLSGTGNIKVSGPPQFKLSPDIEVYDPKITDNTKSNTSGTSGDKIFEYLLIPRHYGDYSIPAIQYSFFNPAKKQYETLKTNEYHFNVLKGNDQEVATTVFGGVSKEDVKYLGQDVRYIKNKTEKLVIEGSSLITKRSFYSIYGFSLLIFLAILIIRREHVKRNSDLSMVRNRKAGKVARQRLLTASRFMKAGQTDRYYEEILKAIWGYLSDKLNIPISELTRNNAIEVLSKDGINDSIIEDMIQILDKCEYARYAPSAAETEIGDIFEAASGLIRNIENRSAQ
jgi:hypothetical protein